jgi:hypothetical protein
VNCGVRVGLGLAALALLGEAGCATCRPEAPPVEPSVEARGSGGTRGFDRDARVDFEVSNLFCRAPRKEAGSK